MISVTGLIKLNLGEERKQYCMESCRDPEAKSHWINAAHLMNIKRSTETARLIGPEADLSKWAVVTRLITECFAY